MAESMPDNPTPLLPAPEILEPFNASLVDAGFLLLDPGGNPIGPGALPCGGSPEDCLSEPVCPHGWAVRRSAIRVASILAGHLVGQRAPLCRDPDLFDALLILLEDRTRLRFDLDSTVGELVETYDLLDVLYDSASTIVSISSLDEVSRRILDQAGQVLGADQASLMLLDPASQMLTVTAARGSRSDRVGGVRLAVGEGLAGYVAEQGRALLIEELSGHPMARRATREEDHPGSLLSVPLKVKDRVLGVLNVTSKRSGQPFTSGDQKLLSALADLAALSIENARTYQNAITDRLTGLYNYGYFKEQFESALQQARQTGAPLSLLMFDLDFFKNFNDRNGHELANVVLQGVARICLENSRQDPGRAGDLVARYGGEEFILMLSGVARGDAFQVAQRIRGRVEAEPFEGAQNQPGGRVTISMGVAGYPEDADSTDALINRADEALYRAKRSGRNHVELA